MEKNIIRIANVKLDLYIDKDSRQINLAVPLFDKTIYRDLDVHRTIGKENVSGKYKYK